jgi:hypothetical protein
VTFGPDQVYEVQPRSFDPGDLSIDIYLPPHAEAGQPYTGYVLAINHGSQSYAVPPTQLLHVVVSWETAEAVSTSSVEGDPPLVTSPHGGAAIIPLSLEAPDTAGRYRLRVEGKGELWGQWSGGGDVEVGHQADRSFPVPARVADWSLPPSAHAGQTLDVRLTWHALGKIDAYYSAYVKLLRKDGTQVTGWDGQPRGGQAPTLEWLPGQKIDDIVTLRIPADATPGDYVVEVGMYRAEDLARALTLNADNELVERVILGTVQVEP